MSDAARFVGLMSGTSLDGIDATLTHCRGAGRLQLIAALHRPFAPELRAELLSLQSDTPNELHTASLVANALARTYASAVAELLAQAGLKAGAVVAIGCHGQTIRHQPQAGYTLQIVNAALLAELTGITVVCDFRSRDVAAGGQGAPLAPGFHDAAFRHPTRHRVIVNIGGISNVTDLAPGHPTRGFDCGPGNLLMDAWTLRHLGVPFDRDGAWARGGRLCPTLLQTLLGDGFFAAAPPKSTGRELFNLAWLERHLPTDLEPRDVQTTLLELTATSIVRAIEEHCAGAQELFLCGGGARNTCLAARLAQQLPGIRVELTDALGLAAEHVEACAFAWLAQQALAGRPANIPAVTGARGARILGAIYPA